MPERDRLIELANKYRETKGDIRPQDFVLENQWLILHTRPPVLVQPVEWVGEPYRSKLRAKMANGQVLVFDPSLIDVRIIKRHVTKKDIESLLSYIFPHD